MKWRDISKPMLRYLLTMDWNAMPFYLASLQGSGVLSSPERSVGRSVSSVSALTIIIFTAHLQACQGRSLAQDRGWVRLWRFCLIKYAYYGPFLELIWTGVPGLIFQVKAIEFGINVGLNTLLNIISRFDHYRKLVWSFVMCFPTSRIENGR